MKLVALAVLASAAASVGASANTIGMQRGLRVETENDDAITVEELRDDDLGANEDFWGSWENDFSENHYAVDISSGSSTPGHNPSVGEAARGILQQAETVVTSALPFSIDHAKSLVLPICLVVAALFAVAIAAVLVGVRRQQLSEPMFGPVELVSDLPVPMTTSAVDNDDSDSDTNPLSDADDTGATILVGEEEEETKEEDRDELVVA